MRTAYLLLVSFALMLLFPGCGCYGQSCFKDTAKAAKHDVVDCTKEAKPMQSIAKSLADSIKAGNLGWDAVEDAAVGVGARIGGCLISNVGDLVPVAPGFSGPSPAQQALLNLGKRTGTSYMYKLEAP